MELEFQNRMEKDKKKIQRISKEEFDKLPFAVKEERTMSIGENYFLYPEEEVKA